MYTLFSFLYFLWKKLCYDNLVLTPKFLLLSVVKGLISLCFLTFSTCFVFKKCIFHQSKEVFFKIFFVFFLRSIFISIHDFNQAFCLIFLCKMFKTNSWFDACFKLLMCTMYSVLSCKLATTFLTFSIFFLSSVNHCEVKVYF